MYVTNHFQFSFLQSSVIRWFRFIRTLILSRFQFFENGFFGNAQTNRLTFLVCNFNA
jgi:hypothetical protein